MELKRAKVIMLPTEKKANNIYDSDIYLWENKLFNKYNCRYELSKAIPNHLYITSDEDIKEGDWYYDCYDDLDMPITQCNNPKEIDSGSVKIIASTDDSLGLPKPSDSFIQKYIKEYNVGNVIEDVLVEYEYQKVIWTGANENNHGYCPLCKQEYEWCYGDTTCDNCTILKVNPKDNTITIKKVKDSWNKEEVTKLLHKAWLGGALQHGNHLKEQSYTSFIKENL